MIYVSIPEGAIDGSNQATLSATGGKFQYPKVQLMVGKDAKYDASYLDGFQYPKVQLMAGNSAGKTDREL